MKSMKKISYSEAKKRLLDIFPDFVVRGSSFLPDGYLIVAVPKTVPNDELYNGGFFKVTYAGEFQGYSPAMNPEEFKESLKHPIEVFTPGQK